MIDYKKYQKVLDILKRTDYLINEEKTLTIPVPETLEMKASAICELFDLGMEKLISDIKEIDEEGDQEQNHIIVDELLLKYINNPEVTKAFSSIPKWYS